MWMSETPSRTAAAMTPVLARAAAEGLLAPYRPSWADAVPGVPC